MEISLCLNHSKAHALDGTYDGSVDEAMARATALEWNSEKSGLFFAATDSPTGDRRRLRDGRFATSDPYLRG